MSRSSWRLDPGSRHIRTLDGARALAVLGHSVTTDHISPAGSIATANDGRVTTFRALVRIDTPIEVVYLRNGGILPYVGRQMMGLPPVRVHRQSPTWVVCRGALGTADHRHRPDSLTPPAQMTVAAYPARSTYGSSTHTTTQPLPAP